MSASEMTEKRPTQDVLPAEGLPLDAIFLPRRVALIGANERTGSVGRTILWNLLSNPFGGTVFPINPRRSEVLGVKAYPRIKEVPEPVDLAVLATPAPTVPALIGECVAAGVRGAIIISAGFKEVGPEGAALERQIRDEARRGLMRIVGPNCLGVMNPWGGLNASFAAKMVRPGNVGLVSQSGALLTALLDWSLRENVGFSRFVSLGSMIDVGWGDLIDYLGDDPQTKSILLYMETIGDARSFLSAAREVALTKPIIVIKAGRTEAAARAATSHTGALAGSDDVLEAAFRRSGVLRVDRIAELFSMAEVLAKQPRPRGPRLTMVTNAGGPAVLATDVLIAEGGQLAELSEDTRSDLDATLPAHWSHGNPIDILGDADPERYARSLAIAAQDPNSDGLLVILTPQAMTDPTETAERLKSCVRPGGKPILASWMGAVDVAAGEAILNRAGIATFAYPDTAAHAFAMMWRYSDTLRALYETPMLPAEPEEGEPPRTRADKVIAPVRARRRTILTESESKALLDAYGIPTVPTRVAQDEGAAIALASEMGYPVVLKLHSETITHKTDVGGVRLNLGDADAVRGAFRAIATSVREAAGAAHFQGVAVQPMIALEGYEIIIGSSIDAQFGPVLLFGAGGQLVEVFRDRVLALPPLNTTLARRMMERTRILTALKGVRGRAPVDLAALELLLVRFSQLVVEQPWIKEIDINPLLAAPERLVVLDARVILHDPDTDEGRLPKPAIRPYPTQYIGRWTRADGETIVIRPIRAEDEPLMVRFHEGLSELSVQDRYFHAMNRGHLISHMRLKRLCFIDYDREFALVAVRRDPAGGTSEILGVGQLIKKHGRDEAELALLIGDRYHRQGLGTELLSRIVQVGRDERLVRITAEIQTRNFPMQRLCAKCGFRRDQAGFDSVVHVALDLGPATERTEGAS